MRLVVYTDRHGWKRASYLRDNDPDDLAAQGLPCAMPDLSGLDCEEVKRQINDALIEAGLFSWKDVQRSQNGVHNVVRGVLAGTIVRLYRQQEADSHE